MRVRSPLYSVDARGAFGPGVVFAKAKRTNWARRRLRTPQPKTVAQQTAKNNLVKTVRIWAGIPLIDRLDWDAYGAANSKTDPMGQTYYPSGCNYFSGFGCINEGAGRVPVEEAPVSGDPGPFVDWWVTWFPLLYVIRINWNLTGEAENIEVRWTDPLSAGVSPIYQKFPHIIQFKENLGVVYIGPIEPGWWYGVKGRHVRDSGQYGVWDIRLFDCP